MPYKDPAQHRIAARNWKRKNSHKAAAKLEEFRLLMLEVKSNPCLDCGGKFPVECMDFDHRDGSTKSYAISKMKHLSVERIKEEMSKCDLVCANCHRIRTTLRGQRKLGRNSTKKPRQIYTMAP